MRPCFFVGVPQPVECVTGRLRSRAFVPRCLLAPGPECRDEPGRARAHRHGPNSPIGGFLRPRACSSLPIPQPDRGRSLSWLARSAKGRQHSRRAAPPSLGSAHPRDRWQPHGLSRRVRAGRRVSRSRASRSSPSLRSSVSWTQRFCSARPAAASLSCFRWRRVASGPAPPRPGPPSRSRGFLTAATCSAAEAKASEKEFVAFIQPRLPNSTAVGVSRAAVACAFRALASASAAADGACALRGSPASWIAATRLPTGALL